MKKFRLFALLAVLATFSTVFASWNYYNYADEFSSTAVNIAVGYVSSNDAVNVEPIKITATADETLRVDFVQSEENPYVIKGVVSGPVTVSVEELEEGAAGKYDYSFGIYSQIEDADNYIPSEDKVVKTPITITDGTATITAEAMAEYFDYNIGEASSFEDFKNKLDTFNAMKTADTHDKPVCLKVYATKK